MTKLEKPAGIVVLTHPVHWPLAPQDVVDALTPDLLALPRESLTIDGVRFTLDEGVNVDWEGAGRTTIEQVRALRALLERHPGYVVAYFGGAPIPLALLAGFQVGTWAAVRVFQQRHRSKSWRWLEDSPLIQVPVPTGLPTQVIRARGDAVVCVQTSYRINLEEVRAVVPHPIAEVVISTAPVDLDVLQTEADVEAVAKVFTDVLDQLGANCPNLDYVHVIVAAPVGMTFRLGTCISATAHHRIKAYYYSRHTSPRYRCTFSLQELSAAARADHVGASCHPDGGAIALRVAPALPVQTEPNQAPDDPPIGLVGVVPSARAPQTPSPRPLATATFPLRFDLFLAYPTDDRPAASTLYDLLQPDVRVFMDARSLRPGDRWDREIPAAQQASRATVLLVSSKGDAAWYLGDEIINGIESHRLTPGGHLLVPVVLEPGVPLPYGLRGVQAIDAAAVGGLVGVAAELRQVLARLRGQPEVPPVTTSRATAAAAVDARLLYARLLRVPDALFEQIIFLASIDRSLVSGKSAPLAERALDVSQLAALDQALGVRVAEHLDRSAPWTLEEQKLDESLDHAHAPKSRTTARPLTFPANPSAGPAAPVDIWQGQASLSASPQAAVVTGARVTVTVATETSFTPRTLLKRAEEIGSAGGILVHRYPEVHADLIRWLDPGPAAGVLEIDLSGIVTYTRDATAIATLRKDAPDGTWGTEQRPGISMFTVLQSILNALRLGERLASPGPPIVSVALSGVGGRLLSFDELDARLRPGDRSWQYTFWNHDSHPCTIPTVKSKDVTASGLSRSEVVLDLLEEVAPFFLFRVVSPSARHRGDLLALLDRIDEL